MASNLAVKITADVVDLQTKFAVARAEVSQLTSEMNKLAKQSAAGIIDTAGVTKLHDLSAQVLEAKSNTAQLSSQMRELQNTSGGLGGAVEDIGSKLNAAFKFTGIALAIEGVRRLGEAIVELGGRAAEIQSMSYVLGVTVEQFQAMTIATEEAGVSQQALIRLGERLETMFTKARDGSGAEIEKLKELGFTNDQIISSTFKLNDAFGVLNARLNDAKTAFDTHNHVISEFGVRSAPALAVLKNYSGSEQEVADAMARANGLTKEQTASATALYGSYKLFGTYLQNTFTKVLDSVTENTSRNLGAVADAFKQVFLSAPTAAALQSTIQVPDITPKVKEIQTAMAELTVSAKTFTKEDLEDIRDRVTAEKTGTAERLAAVKELYTATKQFYTDSADVDKVRTVYRELQAEERAYAETVIRERSRAQESVIQALHREIEIKQKVIAEHIALDAKYLNERLGVERAASDADIQINRKTIDAKRDELTEELETRRITTAQWLAGQRQLAEQLAAMDVEELERRKQLYADEPVEAAKAANQIRVVRAQLNADLARLDKEAAAYTAREASQQATEWKRAVGEIQNAESTFIADMLSRRKSASQSLLAIGAQLVTQEIANDARALTAKVLRITEEKSLEQGGFLYHQIIQLQKSAATDTSEEAQTSAVIAGSAARQEAETLAAAAGRAAQAAIAAPAIKSDAARAAAAVYADVASVPVIGWLLAPPAAAAAFAAVSAYSSLASLDVGAWNVPSDMVARVHKGETVMPATFASGFREAVTGGGEAGGGGDTNHHYHMSVSTVDARGFSDLMTSPAGRSMMAKSLQRYIARGGR
jgi:hypothetical protein